MRDEVFDLLCRDQEVFDGVNVDEDQMPREYFYGEEELNDG